MGDGSGKKFGDKMERCLKNVTLRSFDSVLEFFAIMTCFFFCLFVFKKFACLVLTILCVCFFCFSFRIKHENIVALEDIYESPNHLYLVMQL